MPGFGLGDGHRGRDGYAGLERVHGAADELVVELELGRDGHAHRERDGDCEEGEERGKVSSACRCPSGQGSVEDRDEQNRGGRTCSRLFEEKNGQRKKGMNENEQTHDEPNRGRTFPPRELFPTLVSTLASVPPLSLRSGSRHRAVFGSTSCSVSASRRRQIAPFARRRSRTRRLRVGKNLAPAAVAGTETGALNGEGGLEQQIGEDRGVLSLVDGSVFCAREGRGWEVDPGGVGFV